MTSNVVCKTVASYEEHHLKDFLPDHPFALCTDDMGIFGSALSAEYAVAARVFGLDRKHLFGISRRTIELIFDDEAKDRLRKVWDRFESEEMI